MFLGRVTKILTLLAVVTVGTLELSAKQAGQGDLSPNRIIGRHSVSPSLKKGLGFKAYLAQAGRGVGAGLVQLVAQAHRPGKQLARIRHKPRATAMLSVLKSDKRQPEFDPVFLVPAGKFLACLTIRQSQAVAGSTVTDTPGRPNCPPNRIMHPGKHPSRPEAGLVASAQDDMRMLRRLLDIFRPALFSRHVVDAANAPAVAFQWPGRALKRIRFAIDLPSAGAPLTDGRLGAHIALRSNRSRDDRS